MNPSTSPSGSATGRARAAELLCRLLRERPAYRQAWSQHTRRGGRGVHQGAVAHVLAEHLWATGTEPRSNDGLPRQLKDVVSRALSGRTLSPRVLGLFIAAFDMDEHTAGQLWRALLGDRRRVEQPPARTYRYDYVSAGGQRR